jgi:GNAT superfamily N-acetyltransferase
MQLDDSAARPSTVQIREARTHELDTAADFWGRMYHELELGPPLQGDWQRRAVAYFERRQAAGELAYFVADSAGEIVGTAGALLRDGFPAEFNDSKRGYIYGVYVVPAWRGKGIAARLTWATIDWLRARGCSQIRLHASHKAQPMYERFGFVNSNEMVLRV